LFAYRARNIDEVEEQEAHAYFHFLFIFWRNVEKNARLRQIIMLYFGAIYGKYRDYAKI
jgi:hypothetical protein